MLCWIGPGPLSGCEKPCLLFFIIVHFFSGLGLPRSMLSLLIFKSLFVLYTDKLPVLLVLGVRFVSFFLIEFFPLSCWDTLAIGYFRKTKEVAELRGGGQLALLLPGSFCQRGRDTVRIGQVQDGVGAAAGSLLAL